MNSESICANMHGRTSGCETAGSLTLSRNPHLQHPLQIRANNQLPHDFPILKHAKSDERIGQGQFAVHVGTRLGVRRPLPNRIKIFLPFLRESTPILTRPHPYHREALYKRHV